MNYRAAMPQETTTARTWPATAAIGLFAARFFLPAEDAAAGGTMPIAFAWLVLASVLAWLAWRRGGGATFDWADAAGLAFTLPQAVSGLLTLLRPADHRAAVNLTWEWLSLGVAAVVLRRVVTTPADRRRMAAVLVGAVAANAVQGLYQHYVWYPSLAADFVEFEELERTGADPRRLQQLAMSLGPEVTSRTPAERAALRQRVVASTEPLGFFALANTLGGVLACGLAFAATASGRPLVRWPLLIAGGWCFLLAKSRSAVVGLIAAAAAGAVATRLRPPAWLVGAVAVVGVLAGGLLVATGGLDPEVITEAPKSLQYRLEYWSGTAGVLKDAPLLGAGLGNFRSAYLRHKLPGASEEVLDPHNWVLEAWTGGGLLGLLGAVGAVGFGLSRLLRSRPSTDAGELTGRVLPAAAVAAAVVLAMTGFPLFIDGEVVCGLVVFALVAALGGWVWTGVGMRAACLVAAVTLTVHLLASGGFGMPAVVQVWLAAMFVLPGAEDRPLAAASRKVSLAGGVGLAVAAVLCLLTAVTPNMRRQSLLAAAAYEQTAGRGPAEAARLLQQAAEADGLSSEPWVRLAGTRLAAGRRDAARDAAAEAVARNPVSPTLRQWQGGLLRRTGDLPAAADALQAAAAGYPNGASVQADLAVTLADLKRDAAPAAARAVELDGLNREAGHSNLYLDDATRSRLESIIAGAD